MPLVRRRRSRTAARLVSTARSRDDRQGRQLYGRRVIISNSSTLVVLGRSATASAQHVTELIGLQPTDWGEIGDTNVSAKRRRPRTDGRLRDHAMWQLRADDDGTSGDETGFASLRALVMLLTNKRNELQALEHDEEYEIRVDWGGFSDSSQGGFVIEPDLALRFGALGIPLYGTAYSTEDDE